jgi:hypothetical protein
MIRKMLFGRTGGGIAKTAKLKKKDGKWVIRVRVRWVGLCGAKLTTNGNLVVEKGYFHEVVGLSETARRKMEKLEREVAKRNGGIK